MTYGSESEWATHYTTAPHFSAQGRTEPETSYFIILYLYQQLTEMRVGVQFIDIISYHNATSECKIVGGRWRRNAIESICVEA